MVLAGLIPPLPQEEAEASAGSGALSLSIVAPILAEARELARRACTVDVAGAELGALRCLRERAFRLLGSRSAVQPGYPLFFPLYASAIPVLPVCLLAVLRYGLLRRVLSFARQTSPLPRDVPFASSYE